MPVGDFRPHHAPSPVFLSVAPTPSTRSTAVHLLDRRERSQSSWGGNADCSSKGLRPRGESAITSRGAAAILAACVLLDPSARAGEPNPCSKIRFRYVEIIESQGFFGLATPDADPGVVSGALAEEIRSDRWLYELNRDIPTAADWDEYERQRMQLGELCSIVSRFREWGAPVRTLSLVCRADSREGIPTEARYAAGEVTGDCYFSTYSGKSADPERFRAYMLKHASGGTMDMLLGDDEDRYDVIADPKRRARLYGTAIRQAVEGFVYAQPWELFPYDCWQVHAWESTMDWDPPFRCRAVQSRKAASSSLVPPAPVAACAVPGLEDPTGARRSLAILSDH